jgi:primosomal protein N'
MRTLIPLGKRRVIGIVFELLSETDLNRTKQVLTALDEQPILDAPLIQLSWWVAQYYLTTIGEVLATILPVSLRGEGRRTIFAKSGAFAIDDAVAHKILHVLGQKKGGTTVKALRCEISGGDINRALE